MGVVVSSLLLIMEECNVFWLMSSVIEDLLPSHYYNNTLFGAQVQSNILKLIFKSHKVFVSRPQKTMFLNSRPYQVDQAVLLKLVEDNLPDLHAHLTHYGVELNLITLNWFITIFSSVLTPRITLR